MSGAPAPAPAPPALPAPPGGAAEPAAAPAPALPAQPTAWNHLQVPNFYARQPQAAHMSSERPASRSPLTWHTPTPPDRQAVGANPYRHTPTPPDKYRHTPTPPDGPYRHTPTPPDYAAFALDAAKAQPLYGKPPVNPLNPLLNLQQMISDRAVQRDCPTRGDVYARLSPGLALGTMDLSIARSPRASGQNGESTAPASLMIRDASKINSLDSSEIAKLHRAPTSFPSRPTELVASASPTQRTIRADGSNGPESPKPTGRRPAKKVDSILERLNSGIDAVRKAPSPRSVIVSAHSLEDGPAPATAPTCLVRSSREPTDRLESATIPANEASHRDASFTDSNSSVIVSDRSISGSVIREGRTLNNEKSNCVDENSTSSCDKTTPIENKNCDVSDDHVLPSELRTDTPTENQSAPPDSVSDASVENSTTPKRTRRKTCSESETIDNIAAMIASTDSSNSNSSKEVSVNLENKKTSEPEVASEPAKQDNKGDQTQSVDQNSVFTNENEVKTNTDSNSSEEKNKSQSVSNSILEVENELEKMFAGIEETASIVEDKPNANSEKHVEIVNNSSDSATPRKKRASRKSSDAASSGLLSSDESTPKKRQKLTKRKSTRNKAEVADASPIRCKISQKNVKNKQNEKSAVVKDAAYDSGSNASSNKSRGPYVQIKGPRDSPLSVSVINTPIQEDDVDKPLQKIKMLKNKNLTSADSNYKNKVKSKGLHSSTLSMKYDATTTDTSWICVFCKRGPHTGPNREVNIRGRAQNMGDLFGPYVISSDCPDYVSMMNDPKDVLFKGKKKGTFVQNKQATTGGRKRTKSEVDEKSNFPNAEMYYGMVEAGSNAYEVWLHEDCAVWAPGLYLVGAKIVGLDSAVWSCCTMRCEYCGSLGATVACIKRGCQKTMHVNCARADMWSLSEDSFLVYCRDHGLP